MDTKERLAHIVELMANDKRNEAARYYMTWDENATYEQACEKVTMIFHTFTEKFFKIVDEAIVNGD